MFPEARVKALVLESDPEQARRCREALEAAGYAVIEARQPAEVAAEAEAIGLALCDPGAHTMHEELRALLPADRVTWLGVTDVHLGPVNRDLAMLTGAFAELWERPVDPAELVRWAQRVLGAPEPKPEPEPEPEPEPISAPTPTPEPASARGAAETPQAAVEALGAMESRASGATGGVAEAPVSRGSEAETPRGGAGAVAAAKAEAAAGGGESARDTRPSGQRDPSGAERPVRVPRALDPDAVRPEGEFEDSPWLSVLTHVRRAAFDGQVLLSNGEERLVLGFREGALVEGESDRVDLPKWLCENGIIAAEGEAGMREAVATTGAAWGEALDYGRRGLGLDRVHVESTYLLELALRPFGWRSGRYALREGAVTAAVALSDEELDAHVVRALREVADREELAALMRPFRRETYALRRGMRVPEVVAPTPGESEVLAALQEAGHFAADGHASRLAEVQPLLFALLAGGHAGFVD